LQVDKYIETQKIEVGLSKISTTKKEEKYLATCLYGWDNHVTHFWIVAWQCISNNLNIERFPLHGEFEPHAKAPWQILLFRRGKRMEVNKHIFKMPMMKSEPRTS